MPGHDSARMSAQKLTTFAGCAFPPRRRSHPGRVLRSTENCRAGRGAVVAGEARCAERRRRRGGTLRASHGGALRASVRAVDGWACRLPLPLADLLRNARNSWAKFHVGRSVIAGHLPSGPPPVPAVPAVLRLSPCRREPCLWCRLRWSCLKTLHDVEHGHDRADHDHRESPGETGRGAGGPGASGDDAHPPVTCRTGARCERRAGHVPTRPAGPSCSWRRSRRPPRRAACRPRRAPTRGRAG